MKFVLSSVWSQSVFLLFLLLHFVSPLSFHEMPLTYASKASIICSIFHCECLPPLWCVKWDIKIKPPFLQEHCASLPLLKRTDLEAVHLWQKIASTCEENHTHSIIYDILFWSEPSSWCFLVSLGLIFLRRAPPSSSVSEDFRRGWDDRFNWSWGFDTRRLWQATLPFRQIAPHHQTSSTAHCGRLFAGSWRALKAGEGIGDANHNTWAAVWRLFFRSARGNTSLWSLTGCLVNVCNVSFSLGNIRDRLPHRGWDSRGFWPLIVLWSRNNSWWS